jgi:HAMP domain-containing protein
MSSVRLIRILRSASFRLPLLYAVLFILSAGALFVTVYWTATAAMQSDMSAVLRSEAYQLAEVHRRSGLSGLADQITRRINFRTRGPIFYLLQAPNRRVVVGNLPGMPPVEGSIDFIPQREAPEADVDHSKLMGFGLTLPDGSFLLVAQDSTRLTDMQHAIVRAFFWSSGLALLLAIAGGAVLGTNFLRRIDTITRTSRAIMEGDLSARIPVRGTQDEIDQLVSSLNAMLARIQQLMDGLRQVSSDIAHDLRTPLGRLRQQLEDARERATSTADYEAATDAAIEEADSLLETFSALLRIAQVEAGAQKSGFAEFDLSDLLSSLGETYTPVAEDAEHPARRPDRQRREVDGRPPTHRPARFQPSGERATPYAGRREALAAPAQAGNRLRAGDRRQWPGHSGRRARQGVRPLLSPRPQPFDIRQRPGPRHGEGHRRPARPYDQA